MAIKFGRPIELRDAPLREVTTPAASLDLTSRPRRNRKSEWARRLVRENVVTTDDLIWPLFVMDGDNKRATVNRPVDEAGRPFSPSPCRAIVGGSVRARGRTRDEAGHSLHRPFPLHRTIAAQRGRHRGAQPRQPRLPRREGRAIKREFPELGVLCDVALDPYTSHGHDGLVRDGKILNDETVELLAQQALVPVCFRPKPAATSSRRPT